MPREFETSKMPKGQTEIEPVRRVLERMDAETFYQVGGGRPDRSEYQANPDAYEIYFPEPLPGENAFQLVTRQSFGLVKSGIELIRQGLAGKNLVGVVGEPDDDPHMAEVTVSVGKERINLGLRTAAGAGVDIPEELNQQVVEVASLLEQSFNSGE